MGSNENSSSMKYTCTKCNQEKDISAFYKDKSKKDGIHSNCIQCQSTRVKQKRKLDTEWNNIQKEKSKLYRKNNPEKVQLGVRDATYRSKYGITYKEFVSKIDEQSGCCKICSTKLVIKGRNCPEKAVVDHCHTTGKVRGVICHRCSVGLVILKTMLIYLILLRSIYYPRPSFRH